MEQLTRDVTFLRDLGLIDYSLLIGIQPSLQMSNSRPDTTASLAQLVNSLKRSSLSFPSSAAGFVFCFFVFLCLNKYVKFEDQFEIPVAINISRQTFLIVFLWLQKWAPPFAIRLHSPFNITDAESSSKTTSFENPSRKSVPILQIHQPPLPQVWSLTLF